MGGCDIGKMPDIQKEELNWDWAPGSEFISCLEGNPRCTHYIAEGKKDIGRRDHMSKSEMIDWLSRGED
ncbi:hypothetical protein KKB43_04710 [Patescibacteria group bacterium]|nr:hypothetical protein [Patescibacteria group bacterium]